MLRIVFVRHPYQIRWMVAWLVAWLVCNDLFVCFVHNYKVSYVVGWASFWRYDFKQKKKYVAATTNNQQLTTNIKIEIVNAVNLKRVSGNFRSESMAAWIFCLRVWKKEFLISETRKVEASFSKRTRQNYQFGIAKKKLTNCPTNQSTNCCYQNNING